MTAQIRIGISGWRYPAWRGVFYPTGLTQKNELRFASRVLSSIELNGSFYSLQRPESYASWHAETPDDFLFSVKGPRFITHMKRLKDIEAPLANFLASGLFELKEKLGPLLWQFPDNFRFEATRFESFLALLPTDTRAAARIAKQCEPRMQGRCRLETDTCRPVRHAVEVRHPSFADPVFIDLLRRYNVALVIADTAGKWLYHEDITADFIYIRLHGDEQLYASSYSDAALDRWAKRIEVWRRGGQPGDAQLISPDIPPAIINRDVYCYFDNDMKVHAPFDADRLCVRLGLKDSTQEWKQGLIEQMPKPVRKRR